MQKSAQHKKWTSFLSRHQGFTLYILCAALLALYLLLCQTNFTLSGDTWAEAFPEYVNDVLTKDPSDIIQSSWAGYLTIIPSFLTQLYVSSHLPLGNIDYYFRFVTLTFAVLCCSFIAHPFNRRLIKSDALRFFLAFLTLFSICHVSGLAFINIWYVGFIAIMLVCTSRKQLTLKRELAFTTFAALICLTKPSLIIIPFVLYRLARQLNIHQIPLTKTKGKVRPATRWKNWIQTAWKSSKIGIISSCILLLAIAVESYLTVFGQNGFSSGAVHVSPLMLIPDLFLASGTLLLKVLHVPFITQWLVLISSAFVVMLFVVLFHRTKLLTITMALCLLLGIYLHIYSPDNTLDNVWMNFLHLYSDQTKLQRELVPNFMLLLALFMNIGYLLESKLFRQKKSVQRIFIAILALLFVIIAKPWGTIINQNTAQFYSVDISNYRASLNNNQPVCMPLAPTAFLDNTANWFFQYNGGCYHLDSGHTFSQTSFTHRVNDERTIRLKGGIENNLKTVVLPIKIENPKPGMIITIQDQLTGKKYTAAIRLLPSPYQQLSFNTSGIDQRPGDYVFTLHLTDTTNVSLIYTGTFENTEPALYGLYMGTPR